MKKNSSKLKLVVKKINNQKTRYKLSLLIFAATLALGGIYSLKSYKYKNSDSQAYKPTILSSQSPEVPNHPEMVPNGKFSLRTIGTNVDLQYENPDGSIKTLVAGDSSQIIRGEGEFVQNGTSLKISPSGEYAAYFRQKVFKDNGYPTGKMELYIANSKLNRLLLINDNINDSESPGLIFKELGWVNDYFVFFNYKYHAHTEIHSVNAENGQVIELLKIVANDNDPFNGEKVEAKIEGDKIVYTRSWDTFHKSKNSRPDYKSSTVSVKPSGEF
jgi:hypothetical protein